MTWLKLALKALIILAVLIALGTAATLWRAEARSRAIEARYPPQGQLIEVNGRMVHAHQMGSGPDVVLIHGAGGTTRDMALTLAPMLAERYRVTMFDRPGHGYSQHTDPRYRRALSTASDTPREQAAAMKAAADALGITRPIVLGHSYGGAVALTWASEFPGEIAALVNVAGVALPWPGDLGAYYTVNGSRLGSFALPPLINAWAPQGTIAAAADGVFAPNDPPEAYAERVGAALAVRTGPFRANARQVNSLRPYVVEQSKLYDQITAPIELVHGDIDDTVPLAIHAGPLSERLPGAALTVLEGVAHMPHHTAPDAVVAAVDRAAARAGLR